MLNNNKLLNKFKLLFDSIIPLDADDLVLVVRIQNSNEASKLRNFITFTIRHVIRLNRWKKGNNKGSTVRLEALKNEVKEHMKAQVLNKYYSCLYRGNLQDFGKLFCFNVMAYLEGNKCVWSKDFENI